MSIMYVLLGFSIGAIAGLVIVIVFFGKYSAIKSEFAKLSAKYDAETKGFDEKIALMSKAREELSLQFKNLANEIFEEKAGKFSEKNKESLKIILDPLHTRLVEFRKQVEDTYDKETRDRTSLKEQIRQLAELNRKVSEDALNLTTALKGQTKTQGTWGELILERVLEQSGLRKGREYESQVRLKNDEKQSYQPDVVVHLPNKRDVIIDSKVSLLSYERYCSGEESEKETNLKALLVSIQNHIKDLHSKVYQNLQGVKSLDFVLMFLPMEGAFSLILQENQDIFNDAFQKKIIMVSPTTLLATLRTIQNSWRYEDQNRNAQAIAEKAGRLYDKFVSFTEDLTLIGSRLDSTKNAYEDAMNKLGQGKGNIIKRIEDIRKMGIPVAKKMGKEIEYEDDSLLAEDTDE